MNLVNRAIYFVFGEDSKIKMEILGLFLLMIVIPLIAANPYSGPRLAEVRPSLSASTSSSSLVVNPNNK